MLLTIFPATVAKELNGYAETATKELTRILEGLLRPLLFSQEHWHTDVHGACSRKQLSFGFFGFLIFFFFGGFGFFCGRRMYGSEGQRVGGVPASYTNADWGSLSLGLRCAPVHSGGAGDVGFGGQWWCQHPSQII
jgi:hypothetical protein